MWLNIDRWPASRKLLFGIQNHMKYANACSHYYYIKQMHADTRTIMKERDGAIARASKCFILSMFNIKYVLQNLVQNKVHIHAILKKYLTKNYVCRSDMESF